MAFHHFGNVEQTVLELEALLKANGIAIMPGSELERICLETIHLLERKEYPKSFADDEDIRPYFADILGLFDLAKHIVNHRTHPSFSNLLGHLRLLNQGSPTQNTKTPVHDPASAKIFELLIACCSMYFSADVTMDDPTSSSKGKNPDVIATFECLKWGFACKVLNSLSPITIAENIQKGVQQIENADVERGLVVLNFKNIIDHEEMWPILGRTNGDRFPIFAGFSSIDPVVSKLQAFATTIANSVPPTFQTDDSFSNPFEGKKAFSGYMSFLQTATGVCTHMGPTATRVSLFCLSPFFKDPTPEEFAIVEYMNRGLHAEALKS